MTAEGDTLSVRWFAPICFVAFFVWSLMLRSAALPHVYFINEDAALILGAKDAVGWRLFFEAYGPNFIRPWQLFGYFMEQGVLGWSARSSIAFGFAILAAAATVAAVALRPHVGWVGALCTGLFWSGASVSSESMMWLSARHDLYLSFYFACALAAALALLDGRLSVRRGVVLLLVAFVGAFYSNEKSAAVPTLVTGAACIFALTRPGIDRLVNRKALIVGAASAASTVAYFLFRFAVIGQFIGGYNNRILPKEGMTLGATLRVLQNAVTVPLFGQVHLDRPSIAVCAISLGGFVAALALAPWASRRRVGLVALVVYGCTVAAALPTLAWFINPAPGLWSLGALGVLNVRGYWLPHTVLAIALGVAAGALWNVWKDPRVRALLAFVFFAQAMVRGAEATEGARVYGDAGEFMKTAIARMREHCPCVQLRGEQVSGLHPLQGGVNSFTERSWIDFGAHHAGLRLCEPGEPRCAITMTAIDPFTIQVRPTVP